MSKCIINYSSGNYIKSQKRLRETLERLKWDGGVQFWSNELPVGSRPHLEVPYQFKPFAFWNAYLMGYRQILWMDAPIHPNKELDSIFSRIYKNGYFVLGDPGWNNGEWCADSALTVLGLDRELAFSQPHCLSGVLGFNLNIPEVFEVFQKWKHTSDQAFPGDWKNDEQQVSNHPRVRGHRHDQTAIAALAYQAGWEFTSPHENNLFFYGKNEDYILNIFHA